MTTEAPRVHGLRSTPTKRELRSERLLLALDRTVIGSVTLLWTALVAAIFLGVFVPPLSNALVAGYPLALVTALACFDLGVRRPELQVAAGWSSAVAGAFFLVPRAIGDPTLAVGAVAILVAAVVCWRFPAASVVALLAMTGFQASVVAFFGIDLIRLADLVLAGLWLGLGVRIATGTREQETVVWPAMLLLVAYIAMTAVMALSPEAQGVGWLAFRISAWFMLAVVLMAHAGFGPKTRAAIVRGFVVATVAVAGYAVLRWIIGPADAEAERAIFVDLGINFIEGRLRVFGSFLTGHQLGFWTSVMGPFCLALALAWRGRWRVVAAVAVALCVLASLGAEARGPMVGMVVGFAAVLVVNQLSVGTGRLRAAAGLAGALGILVLGVGGYALTVENPSARARFERVLDPSSDAAYAVREVKWDHAFADLRGHPFGLGLGTAGQTNRALGRYRTVAALNLDNSYVKVAYEQGTAILAYFAVTMIALLATIVLAAIRARTPERAGPGIAAAGAMSAMLVAFYSGLFIEGLGALAAWLAIGIGIACLVTRERPHHASATDDERRVVDPYAGPGRSPAAESSA